MSVATLDLKRWGNNLGVRLPAAVARAANLHADQRVSIEVDAGRVIITPVVVVELTLEQRLAAYNAARHGGEVMTAEPLGAEKIPA